MTLVSIKIATENTHPTLANNDFKFREEYNAVEPTCPLKGSVRSRSHRAKAKIFFDV